MLPRCSPNRANWALAIVVIYKLLQVHFNGIGQKRRLQRPAAILCVPKYQFQDRFSIEYKAPAIEGIGMISPSITWQESLMKVAHQCSAVAGFTRLFRKLEDSSSAGRRTHKVNSPPINLLQILRIDCQLLLNYVTIFCCGILVRSCWLFQLHPTPHNTTVASKPIEARQLCFMDIKNPFSMFVHRHSVENQLRPVLHHLITR